MGDEPKFPPGWLRRDTQQATKRIADWARANDERKIRRARSAHEGKT